MAEERIAGPKKTAQSLLQVDLAPSWTVYSCITAENQLSVAFVKEETINSRGQTVLRDQRIVCSRVEIEGFKKFYHYWSTFNSTMSMLEKMRSLRLTPLPRPKRPVAVQMSLTNENIQDSIVYYEKDCGVKASYIVTYKKADKAPNLEHIYFFVD